MSWAGLANNQTVSFNNLQDAVNNGNFTALTTIPVSTEQITKSDASTYVNCDTSFASFAAKSSNQLVVKSNLVTTTTTSTTTTSSTTTTTTPSLVDIFIDNNNSLDIPITGMTINGVAVTYDSGSNFTINAGNNGNFTSAQLGVYTVVISYGSHTPGQNITFVDSDNNITCQDLNGSGGTFTIPSSSINGGTTIYVTAADGACI